MDKFLLEKNGKKIEKTSHFQSFFMGDKERQWGMEPGKQNNCKPLHSEAELQFLEHFQERALQGISIFDSLFFK